MSVLPEQTYLGRLEILEVYEATDEPCLFACRNGAGHVFLAVLIDETEEERVWLYTPLSPGRFARVRGGEVDLRDGFRAAEDGFVHRVVMSIFLGSGRGSANVGMMDCDELTDAMLPLAGERLNVAIAQVA
jgi:hypothetical protein